MKSETDARCRRRACGRRCGGSRFQGRALGAAFRERGIGLDVVFTSQWCRARETAGLPGLGEVVEAPETNSFFRDFSRRNSQTIAALALLPGTEGRAMLVSHQVNISALAGRGTRSGDVLVVRLSVGMSEVLGSILLEPEADPPGGQDAGRERAPRPGRPGRFHS